MTDALHDYTGEIRRGPDERLVWTGKLLPGERPGDVKGWLYNHHSGVRIEFTGAKDPRPKQGYLIIGKAA